MATQTPPRDRDRDVVYVVDHRFDWGRWFQSMVVRLFLVGVLIVGVIVAAVIVGLALGAAA